MLNLDNFVQNTEDPAVNFALAQDYESLGQTGAAISFYLRAAERSQDKTVQYHALVRMALCFQRQRTRDDTQTVLLQKSIALDPTRPEAYFLLARLYEYQKKWHESFFVASVGCHTANFATVSLPSDVQYPGQYGLLFQKAVALWWVGNCDESRDLFYYLKNHCNMTDEYVRAVDVNLQNITTNAQSKSLH